MGTEQQDLPALGQPANHPEDTDTGTPDIAGEHQDAAVDKRVITGDGEDREEESPRGWSGMDDKS